MELKLPTIDEIRKAYHESEEATVDLFLTVIVHIQQLASQIEQQAGVIQALQAQLDKNSQNSSKPPSSDGYKKPPVAGNRTQSQRQKGQKPTGGQTGHKGHTLEQAAEPDRTLDYTKDTCQNCGANLADGDIIGEEERQVFDIPALRIEITAHRVRQILCPVCGHLNQGVFPEGVKAPVQYGQGIRSVSSLLHCGHYIPVARTVDIIEELFNHRVSEAVVLGAIKPFETAVKPAMAVVKQGLIASKVLNADESGLRVMAKLHWLHVACTDKLTYYTIHAKRGQEAMDGAGILPHFKGELIHDHLKSYFNYNGCHHRLCNAHHLRELEWVATSWQQPWATEMGTLLREIHQAVVAAKREGKLALPETSKGQFEQRYEQILAAGHLANPPPAPQPEGQPKKRGRPAQSPPRNLLLRLENFKTEVLGFMYDFAIPFDNNQAERDVRMVKVKQKISGGFRTTEGSEAFATIAGYLSTARKNGKSALAAIKDALSGKPFIPEWLIAGSAT